MADRKASIPGGTIVFHSKGFQEILNSAQVQELVEDAAQKASVEAMTFGSSSPSKQYSYQMGKTDRARAIVYTASRHAKHSNAKHNSLKKAIRQVKI